MAKCEKTLSYLIVHLFSTWPHLSQREDTGGRVEVEQVWVRGLIYNAVQHYILRRQNDQVNNKSWNVSPNFVKSADRLLNSVKLAATIF